MNFNFLSKIENREMGAGMLEALLAVGFVGLLAAGISATMRTGLQSNAKINIDQERAQLRNHISERIDCRRTFTGINIASCVSAGSQVNLLRADGSAVIPGNRLGKWEISAKCETIPGAGAGVVIRSAKRDAQNNFWKDPTNQQLTLDFNHPRTMLFERGMEPCSQVISPPANACPAGSFPIGTTGTQIVCSIGSTSCPANQVMDGFNANGSIRCVPALAGANNCMNTHGPQALMVGINPNGTPICVQRPVLDLSKVQGYSLSGDGQTASSNAAYCTVQNMEFTDAGGSTSGFDCQVFGGPGSWQMFSSSRATNAGSRLCQFYCYNYQ